MYYFPYAGLWQKTTTACQIIHRVDELWLRPRTYPLPQTVSGHNRSAGRSSPACPVQCELFMRLGIPLIPLPVELLIRNPCKSL